MDEPAFRVILTHAEGRLESLAEALCALGLEVSHTPLIETRRLPSVKAAQARELLACDWLLFTSRSAVDAWRDLGLPLRGVRPNLGAVGSKTGYELEHYGGSVALTATPANARGLVQTFLARVSPPKTVGFPCSRSALPTLEQGLTRAGFEVVRLPLYETVTRSWKHTGSQNSTEMTTEMTTENATESIVEIIVLASPSAVSALPTRLGARAQLVALGPSTGRALAQRGWRYLEAATPTAEGVTNAVQQVVQWTLSGKAPHVKPHLDTLHLDAIRLDIQ